jgi:FkbM family methyltransferase
MRPGQLRDFREQVAFYRSLLPRNALCFDIGANIGDKSEALLAAGAGRVVAFEPNPGVIAELKARCGHDPRWTMVETAIGSGPPLQTFYPTAGHGSSSMNRDWNDKVVSEVQVHVGTLDAAIAMWGVPDYCKIDVEGWEPQVLSGLTQRLPLVSFEFHLDPAGIDRAKACLTRLRELGGKSVNITPAESARFHFDRWREMGEMLAWFPGDLRQTLPGDPYGDLFVRFGSA